MTFIAGISTSEALGEEIDFLGKLFDRLPWLASFFELLAPLLVIVVNGLLPTILEFLTMFEGPVSSSVVTASVFVKLSAFMIIQTFFVSAIGSGLFASTFRTRN